MKDSSNLRLIFASLFLAASFNIFGERLPNLMDVFHEAAKNDPTYQQQVATYQAAFQALPISQAGVLPSLDLNAAIAKVIQDTSFDGSSNLTQKNYGLTVTQTLFNYSTFKQIASAKASVISAAYTLSAAGQALMIQVAQAYYNVLQAHDLINYTEQQKAFIYNQYQATQTRYDHREATITDLNQAKGAYELILVQLNQAQQQFYTNLQLLEQLTAKRYTNVAGLKSHFPLVTPKPNNLSSWVEKAKRENLTLLAAKTNLMAMYQNINVARGNYLPNITASGDYSTGRQIASPPDGDTLQTEHFNNVQAGVNLQWNVFQGGLTHAQVEQAKANFNAAYAQRNAAYLNAITSTRIAYDGIMHGIMQIQTGRAAMQSNLIALQNAEQGYRSGLITITEVLQIQYQLYQSQQVYISDLYQYLNDLLLLQQAAGTLSISSMITENQWLT